MCAAGAALPDPASLPAWNGCGNDASNSRFQNAKAAGLTAADVPKLTLKWAFGFPGATVASGQPTVAAGRVFVGNVNGMVYSLDAKTGCTHWTFKADGGVRTAITVARLAIDGTPRTVAMFGDIRANAYAIDAQSGTLIWKTKVDDHAMARVTGAPSYHNGRLYVPVSSIEEVAGARPNYECCTFRGSVVALDAATGKQVWKTYTMEEPKMVGKNSAGTPQWKPAGAAIWTAPTIDTAKNAIYVATGNAYTTPAAPTSDAVIALDLTTGAIRWVQQVTPNDTFVIGCKPGVAPCADEVGPDFDFGNPPILRTCPAAVACCRSVRSREWSSDWRPMRTARCYGSTAPARAACSAASNGDRPRTIRTSMFRSPMCSRRLNKPADSTPCDWPPASACGTHRRRHCHARSEPGCTGAQSAPVSVMPGVVFSGSIDGHFRAYSTRDGKIIWDFNTMQPFETVNGVKAQGGSIDAAGPVIAGGMVYTNSGYGQWRGKPGNVLLAFGLP